MAGALEGIKILDLTSVGFGPYACKYWATTVRKLRLSAGGDITWHSTF